MYISKKSVYDMKMHTRTVNAYFDKLIMEVNHKLYYRYHMKEMLKNVEDIGSILILFIFLLSNQFMRLTPEIYYLTLYLIKNRNLKHQDS